MILPPDWDFKNPDYAEVYRRRAAALGRLRANPSEFQHIRAYYKENPAAFINDWGCTTDPRLVERGLPAVIPFILFPKQVEWVNWVVDCWRNQEPGLTEKSRDVGMSWLSVSLSCTLCLFHDGMQIGFGSRKAEYVDLAGSPKSLFHRAREFMSMLPIEFRGGWRRDRDAPYMRMKFPDTGSALSGESGDNIGRGDRSSIYFVDESAFLERPQMIEASLSATTNCRMDISSANGMANPFAQKIHAGKIKKMRIHWRDDPRKDEAWYAKQCDELDPITVASELDINYSASVDGVLIPSAWIQSAIGAARKLGLYLTGRARGAFDVADQGADMNAFLVGQGVALTHLEEWSGRGDDMLGSAQRVFAACDTHKITEFRYDADGLGAGVAGFARALNEPRKAQGRGAIAVHKFQGSAGVVLPDAEDEPGRKNKDFFSNLKAQSWWALRKRAQLTHQAVSDAAAGVPYKGDPDAIWSIDESLPLLGKLCNELSQPTFSTSVAGKILVDKTPDGAKSPNLADAVMIYYAKLGRGPMQLSPQALAQAMGRRG